VTQWLEAAAATPQATLSPLSLDFGTQQTNSSASTQTVTLKNSGKAALNISGVTILGTTPSDFSQINDCGSSLAAGTSCSFKVSFKPGSTGAKSATLTIANNASGSPHTVPLSGTGAAAPQTPSLLKQVISSVNGVANNTCKTPPAVGSFKTTDASVWLYFEANPVSPSDVFHLKYYKPDGTGYTTIDAKTTLSGYVCYSYYINIAGDAPASLPGNWTVKIFYNQNSNPMATLNFTIVNASGPTQPGVTLSRYFNVTGIYNAGSTFSCSGGVDSVGYAYTSSVLKSPLTWSSNTFTLGPANAPDAVSDTTIVLSGQSDRLNFLAIGVNGNQEDQQFVVRYTDGSSDTYTQSISDWFTPQYYPYESIAAAVPSRSVCNGGTEKGPFYVYGYAFALNSGKTLSSIALPANSRVVVLAMTLSSSGGTPVISSVADGATFTSPISSGGWLMIKGTNLARGSGAGRIWNGADFSGTRLPTSLDGVSVTVNGKSAYVYYASPTQINALVPTDPTTGNVNVQVTTAKGTSNVVSVSKQVTSPGVFWYQNQYAIATAGPATIGPLRPARPGEIITLWCAGLGPTSPSYPDGTVVSNVYNTAFPVTVTIGGVPATVLFAGLTSTGLYQINLTVPRVPDGNAAVYVNVGGQRSAEGITMAIRGQ
jgi:uncharacterized protein (TIGR03437 family)